MGNPYPLLKEVSHFQLFATYNTLAGSIGKSMKTRIGGCLVLSIRILLLIPCFSARRAQSAASAFPALSPCFRWSPTGKTRMSLSSNNVTGKRRRGTRSASSSTSIQVQKSKSRHEIDIDIRSQQEWLEHTDITYHNLSTDEARAIRQSLLQWYDLNRRKLPWRGDPSPWTGSSTFVTANDTKKKDLNQKKLDAYFVKKKELKTEIKQEDVAKIFPVTGYGVWVSEIMLQQTRVEAVVPYWVRWMTRFPTIQDLARADPEAVNAQWAGLGFYRRARLLHQGAQYIIDKCDGSLPTSKDELLQIPGVGPYTASAIASIVYNEAVPVVDGNVCRVLSRLCGIANNVKAPALKDKHGWDLAGQIVLAEEDRRYGDVNQALMELGATYCAPSGTGVEEGDPLRKFYRSTKIGAGFWKTEATISTETYVPSESFECSVCSRASMSTAFQTLQDELKDCNSEVEARKCGHKAFPTAPPKTAKREEILAVAVLQCEDSGRWLLRKRPTEGLLAGQWEFPSVCVWNSDNELQRGMKRKDMSSSLPDIHRGVRATMLTEHLAHSFGEGSVVPSAARRLVLPTAIEHVFSHVRHSMYIEYGTVVGDELDLPCDTQFMDEKDMKQVGVTSGVKKIINATLNACGTNPRKRN